MYLRIDDKRVGTFRFSDNIEDYLDETNHVNTTELTIDTTPNISRKVTTVKLSKIKKEAMQNNGELYIGIINIMAENGTAICLRYTHEAVLDEVSLIYLINNLDDTDMVNYLKECIKNQPYYRDYQNLKNCVADIEFMGSNAESTVETTGLVVHKGTLLHTEHSSCSNSTMLYYDLVGVERIACGAITDHSVQDKTQLLIKLHKEFKGQLRLLFSKSDIIINLQFKDIAVDIIRGIITDRLNEPIGIADKSIILTPNDYSQMGAFYDIGFLTFVRDQESSQQYIKSVKVTTKLDSYEILQEISQSKYILMYYSWGKPRKLIKSSECWVISNGPRNKTSYLYFIDDLTEIIGTDIASKGITLKDLFEMQLYAKSRGNEQEIDKVKELINEVFRRLLQKLA